MQKKLKNTKRKHVINNSYGAENLPFLLKSRCSKKTRLAIAGGMEMTSLSDIVNFLNPWQ